MGGVCYYYNVKIKDLEYELAGNLIYKYGVTLDEYITQYILCLSNIATNAVPSGEVHETILHFIAYFSSLKGKAKELGEKFRERTGCFVNEIDRKDRYLYEAGGGVVRDFTDKEFNCLHKMLKDEMYDFWDLAFQDSVTDWFKDKVYWKVAYCLSGVKWDDTTNPGVNIKKCHKRLLDYNDATYETIRDIFNNVAQEDGLESQRFQIIIESFEELRKFIAEASYIINPKNGKFTIDAMDNKLAPLLANLTDIFNQAIELIDYNKTITIEQIENFVSQPWSSTYFQGFNSIFSDFLSDIGALDLAVANIYNHVTVDTILVKDMLKNFRFDKDAYEKNATKSELMNMLDEMAETYRFSGSEEQKIIGDGTLFVKYLKKYNKEWYKYLNSARDKDGKKLLDGRTKEAKEFNDFINKLGNVEKILKYGDSGIDLLVKLYSDYSLNLKILNSFTENASYNPVMSECAQEIKLRYEDKMYLLIDEMTDELSDYVIDGGKDIAEMIAKKTNLLKPLNVVGYIETAIDVSGEIGGLGGESKSLLNSITYINIYNSSLDAYWNALEKVKNCDREAKNYETLVKQLEDCFNMTKSAGTKAFKSMAGYYGGGTQKAYYDYCAGVAENATMYVDDFHNEPLHFLSYDQWLQR